MNHNDLNETKTVANINGIEIVRSTVQVQNQKSNNGKSYNRMAGNFRYERRWNLFLNGQELSIKRGVNRRLSDVKKQASNLESLLVFNRNNEELKRIALAK